MARNMSKNKPIRFAALVRVSTEKQEKQGESLRTQRQQIEQVVEACGGVVVDWFGGQEHATAGWEHREVDRLLAYCERRPHPVDAVMVAHQDRWSRDNIASEQGLNRLQKEGVRFFVLANEHDLNEPTARLYLAMSSSIGAYHAANQKKKSLENRIARAKRGIPTGGKLPYGRTFDRTNMTWGVDPKKKALVEEVARRYLAGESMEKLAAEHGVNHTSLHKTLMKRSGPEWEVIFQPDGVVIRDEPLVVPVTVPPLLQPRTIAALHKRSRANKTYQHGQIKHPYLLRRVVFCANCGHAMFGQTNHSGKRYYRHRNKECPSPLHSVPADILEETVLLHLWAAFGNAAKLARAVEDARPDAEKFEEYTKRRERVCSELAKLKKGRERVLTQLENETISEDEATERLAKSKRKLEQLGNERDRLDAALRDAPDPDTTRRRAEAMAAVVAGHLGFETMTNEEKRQLVEMVFGGTTPMVTRQEAEAAKANGERPVPSKRRMGVYIGWIAGEEAKRQKKFDYYIRGHLISEEYQAPLVDAEKEYLAGHYDNGVPLLQDGLTNCASRLPGPFLPECHLRQRSPLRRRGCRRSCAVWGRPSRVLW